MPTQTRLITADEFQDWPDEPGMKQQLVRGEIELMTFPGGQHGEVAAEICALLRNYVKPRKLGKVYAEVGFVMETDPDTVKGPDVAFIRAERLALVTNHTKLFRFAPDLVVEVTSPTDRAGKIREKIAEWMAFGVRLLWQVYPKTRTVAIHRSNAEPVTLTEEDSLAGEDVLPGFQCTVSELFE